MQKTGYTAIYAMIACVDFRKTDTISDIVSYWLIVVSCQLRVASCELPVVSCQL